MMESFGLAIVLCLGFALLIAESSFPSTELAALNDLYVVTNGKDWLWKSNHSFYGIPWNFDAAEVNPCTHNWQGIRCSPNCVLLSDCSIMELLLSGYNLRGSIPASIGNLSELITLDMSNNHIIGSIPSHVCSLIHLLSLNLQNNSLTQSIPQNIGSLMNLQTLTLANNNMNGTLPAMITVLKKLQIVDVCRNKFSGKITGSFYTSLVNMMELSLCFNLFVGIIPKGISHMTKLQKLIANDNYLSGSLPVTIGALVDLKILQLDNNYLQSSLPSSITNCTKLESLLASANLFTGSIPKTIGALTRLQRLNLASNSLSHSIPSSFYSLSELIEVNLGQNQLHGKLVSSIGIWKYIEHFTIKKNNFHGIFPFQNFLPSSNNPTILSSLQELDCGFNVFTGSIPSSIAHLSSLQTLIMNANQLKGTIPCTITEISNLTTVYLLDNLLTGTLCDAFHRLPSLRIFSVSNNHLNGTIPWTLFFNFHITALYMHDNIFTGSIPVYASSSVVTPTPALLELVINSNRLTGSIPGPTMAMFIHLQGLYLYQNHLTGTLPDEMKQLRKLKDWILHGNRLTGTIPNSYGYNMVEMISFSMFHNLFTGTIPNSMGNMTFLSSLELYDNKFSGTLPKSLSHCHFLVVLDIYNNSFTGNLQWIIDGKGDTNQLDTFFPFLESVYIQNNYFTGDISTIATWKAVVNMNISTNYFTSSLAMPHKDYNLSALTYLEEFDCSLNMLTGSVNNIFTTMHSLQLLLLASNQFEGGVVHLIGPEHLNVSVIDLSDNHFSGSVPAVLFQNTNLSLTSFAAVKNCFTGNLPLTICENRVIHTLALDGLYTSPACKEHIYFFPLLSSILSGNPSGELPYSLPSTSSNEYHTMTTIPSCLLNMSSLITLHLSGNNIQVSLDEIVSPYEELTNTLSTSLKTLSFSYNQLTGTIPKLLQTAMSLGYWDSLDLSFNKLSGTLYSTNSSDNSVLKVPISSLNSTCTSLTLENNRLSGYVPVQYEDYQEINVLKGNLFTCRTTLSTLFSFETWTKSNESTLTRQLPVNDPLFAEYDCGSNIVNLSLFLYILCFCIIIGLITMVTMLYYSVSFISSKQVNSDSHTIKTIKEVPPALNDNEEIFEPCATTENISPASSSNVTISTNCNQQFFSNINMLRQYIVHKFNTVKLYYFIIPFLQSALLRHANTHYDNQIFSCISFYQELQYLRYYCIFLFLCCSCIFIPVFSILSQFFKTHEYSYIWFVSLSFISGIIPLIVLFFVIIMFYCMFDYTIYYFTRKLENVTPMNIQSRIARDDVNENKVNSSIDSEYQSNTLPGDTTTIPKPKTLIPFEISTPNRGSTRIGSVRLSAASISKVLSSENVQNSVYVMGFLLAIFLVNFLIVLIVNICYIYSTTVDMPKAFNFLLVLSVSCFKIGWNDFAILKILMPMLTSTTAGTNNNAVLPNKNFCLSDSLKQKFITSLIIVNNILIPFIANAFVHSNCFYYMVELSPQIVVNYAFITCKKFSYSNHIVTCVETTEHSRSVAYQPPFVYSYQCSSTLLNDFVNVFIFRYAITGVLKPFLWILLLLRRATDKKFVPIDKANDISSEKTVILSPLHADSKEGNKGNVLDGHPSSREQTIVDEVPSGILGNQIAISEVYNRSVYNIILVGDLSIFCTFGIAFPLLGMIIATAVFFQSVYMQLLYGKFIVSRYPRFSQDYVTDKNDHVDEDIEKIFQSQIVAGLKEANSWNRDHDIIRSIYEHMPMLIILSAAFVGFFLFDMLGDTVGAANAWWILLVTIFLPVFFFYGKFWLSFVVEKVEMYLKKSRKYR